MATPPFTGDSSNPADTSIVSVFPSNERTHRDEIFSYLGIEHDPTTGYHAFQVNTTAVKTGLTTPPTGMLYYDSDLGVLQINTGTPSAPNWVTIGAQTGDIKIWPTASAPTGWLTCDGSAVSRTTYADLFAIIGTTFGTGDGSTTFNLPNFQRSVPVGMGGTATATLGNTVGSTGGEEDHTLTAAESAVLTYSSAVTDPGHDHTYTAPTVGASGGTFQNGGSAYNSGFGSYTGTSVTGITVTTSSNAGGGAHNTMQPSVVVNFVIKY